jgi:predicted nuclease of predicted toxin-antitoxin system
VKFLVDAQLPLRLARYLAQAGHDAIHTTDLAEGNRTVDARIAEHADADSRVVVTKDRDFRDSHLLTGSPGRLLVVATGNITNNALLDLFQHHLDAVLAAFAEADYVELGPRALIVHRRRDDDAQD